MRMLRDYGRVQLNNVQNDRLKFEARESSWPSRVCYVVVLAVIVVICFSSFKESPVRVAGCTLQSERP